MDVKYVFERSEDFIRAIRANKVKQVFFTQELIPTGENTLLGLIRLTAITPTGIEHLTLNEIAYNGARHEDGKTPVEDTDRINEALATKKNDIHTRFSSSAPDVLLTAGAVFP